MAHPMPNRQSIPENDQPMTSNVGLVGLGAMGGGMARSLRRAGYKVHVFDLRAEAAQAFAREGGVACAVPAGLAAHCQVIVSVVVNAAQTGVVLFGKGARRIQLHFTL